MTNNKLNSKGNPYNPTVTAFFPAPKFGNKLYNGDVDAAFLSASIDTKAFTVIQENVQVGSKLLLKKSTKPDKNGNPTYYLEVLAPRDAAQTFNKTATQQIEDGI